MALTLGACATTGQAPGSASQNVDPWENWNRKVFAFNEGLDRAVLKPVATAYVDIVPRPVRKGVDNFFANFADAWSAVNNVLQAKPQPAFEDVVRVGTNIFLGLGGVLDIASEFGLEHHYEDFGRTLTHWGVSPGPYVVLPLLGPSTVRDTVALPVDWAASPVQLVDDDSARFGITVLQVINARANLLGASQLLEGIALDKYTFLRDAYLQRHGSLRFDDNSPDDAVDDGYAPPSDEVAPSVAPPPASAPAAR
jgi:phospholipid-binding lipoprotein MlaA